MAEVKPPVAAYIPRMSWWYQHSVETNKYFSLVILSTLVQWWCLKHLPFCFLRLLMGLLVDGEHPSTPAILGGPSWKWSFHGMIWLNHAESHGDYLGWSWMLWMRHRFFQAMFCPIFCKPIRRDGAKCGKPAITICYNSPFWGYGCSNPQMARHWASAL